jgi:hypothetical protein
MIIKFPGAKVNDTQHRRCRRRTVIPQIDHSGIERDLVAIYRLLTDIEIQLAWPDRILKRQSKIIQKASALIVMAMFEQNKLVREQRDALKGVVRFPGKRQLKSTRTPWGV